MRQVSYESKTQRAVEKAMAVQEEPGPEQEQDEEADPVETSTLPSPPSFRFDQNSSSQQNLLSRAGSGYESQYGSIFGSRFSLTDGSGVFISSVALTIIVSAIAIVGIVLVAVIITLAVLLSTCETHSNVTLKRQEFLDSCNSFRLNAELNNIQDWVVPSVCEAYISNYVHGGQYMKDVEMSVALAQRYLKAFTKEPGKRYAVVLDIDETTLSNALHYKRFDHRSEGFLDYNQRMWVNKTLCSPIFPVLNLYHELRAGNWSIFLISERPESIFDFTVMNLIECGYDKWTSLILRSSSDIEDTVEAYKSSKRIQIEKQGYEIVSVLGDQWSDLAGPASGARTFKLPNPMYRIA